MFNTKYLVGFFAALLMSHAAWAVDEVFVDDGVANRGHDIVAYFSLDDPDADAVEGSKDFQTEHEGYTYYFANQENLDKFKANPDAYLPAYGGYCAYGLANAEKKVKSDPDAWTIVDGKLYLNISKGVRKRWNKDQAAFIETGDKLWPEVKDDKFKTGWF